MKNVSKCLLLIASIITAQPSQDVIFQNFRTNWLFYCLAYAEEIEFLKTEIDKKLQKISLAIAHGGVYLTRYNLYDYGLTLDETIYLNETELQKEWDWLNQYKQDHLS